MERAIDRLRLRGLPFFDLWGYLLFSHGWTWLWWSVNVIAGYEAFGRGLPFTVVGGVGPLLGGVAMTYVTYGPRGLADLRERLTDIERISPRWAATTVLFFPVVTFLTASVTGVVTGNPLPLETTFFELLGDPGAFVATALVILVVGPLPEEVGWRGYLLDRCQVRWSALASGLAVGLVWAVWHAPLFVMPGYFANFDFAPDPVCFGTNVVLVSVVYTWLYNNTDRSVLALVGFHFLENFVGQVTTLPPTAEPIGIVVRVAVVLGVVVWFGRQTFRRDRILPAPPPALS
ncbi:CPBP family intramembrane glutamic endopeptidase [Halosimplex salinum]|uniref:CPBP family intramembrane glutamic endopeptidase n=1 Tax=Halosimplex salinum TaxID=1710538 RepID=UPI000F49B85C|nr:CPBP family intramembrane glutamic endopeptidase [Halosimplex salinum]